VFHDAWRERRGFPARAMSSSLEVRLNQPEREGEIASAGPQPTDRVFSDDLDGRKSRAVPALRMEKLVTRSSSG